MHTSHLFIRSLFLQEMHNHLCQWDEHSTPATLIPGSVFSNPMNLIPCSEMIRWYEEIIRSYPSPHFALEMNQTLNLKSLGSIGLWMFSGTDAIATIRRINFGMGSLCSGVYMSGAQTGKFLKWSYRNPSLPAELRVHDAIRVAVFQNKVLRHYLGENFRPARITLPGTRPDTARYERYFGCPVEWNQPELTIWLNAAQLQQSAFSPKLNTGGMSVSFNDLDEFLDMPQPYDEIKVVFEVINYSRHFGLPTLERTSALLGLSTQQFQRRLNGLGLNFTTVCSYVLSIVAINAFKYSDDIDQVARSLGYTNTESFSRMFKKTRGMTPRQYLYHQT